MNETDMQKPMVYLCGGAREDLMLRIRDRAEEHGFPCMVEGEDTSWTTEGALELALGDDPVGQLSAREARDVMGTSVVRSTADRKLFPKSDAFQIGIFVMPLSPDDAFMAGAMATQGAYIILYVQGERPVLPMLCGGVCSCIVSVNELPDHLEEAYAQYLEYIKTLNKVTSLSDDDPDDEDEGENHVH